MRDVTKAAQVMFKLDADPLLVRVLNMLAVRGTLVPDLDPGASVACRGLPYAEVLKVCSSSTSWNSVAQALAGTFAQSSIWEEEVLDALGPSFEPNDHAGLEDEKASPTPQFAMGALLGLFRAVVWFDSNQHMASALERLLPHRLPGMIFSSEPMMIEADSLITKAYEQELSVAIKAWARPNDERHGVVGRRLAQYYELVKNLADKLLQTGSAAAPEHVDHKLRDLVLDQLAYAQFGAISSMGRIMAMSAFFQNTDRLLRERR